MDFRRLSQLFSVKDLRNGLLGMVVVFGGLGWAFFTIWAHRSGNPQLAGIAAAVSLVFVLLILIFVVPPLARNASAEASQMNLPFEFTVGGALVLGLIAVVGFAAWNTGNNLLFLVLSFLAASLIVAFVAGSACLKKLDVKMRFPETIFAGEATPIIVSLHNRKWLFPTLSVITEVRGRERERSALTDEVKKIIPEKWAEKLTRPPIIKHTLDYFVFVPRRGEIENKAEHVFPRRGRFLIRDFELSTRFPFGFFRHRRRLSAQAAEICIFPAIQPHEEVLGDLPLEIGKLVANKRGAGQDLLALRDYQPMDDMRRVDWKATARTRRIIVREFSAEDDKRVTVVFDTRMPKPLKPKTLRQRLDDERKATKLSADEERFESGVSRTASLLSFFNEEQAEIRLAVDEEYGEYGIGREHLHGCLRRLATIEPSIVEEFENSKFEESLADAADERDRSHTFAVTTVKAEALNPETVQRIGIVNF
ncbi:MAG: DUF58 domain-containing protein [Acidobacteria bacterium]|nr:DUF58 domain-containing protein [Acidobacteriota bacterium]MBK8812598.1 DUF58 domain-containing protein [Acidobacteriota bacterium]